MARTSVVIYSKAGCGLCAEAQDIVERVARRHDISPRVIDITTLDHASMLRYRYEIPVVFVDGQERFRHRVDERALEALLAAGTRVADLDADPQGPDV